MYARERGDMYEGGIHSVDDLPRDTADASHRRVSELVEGVGREVEIAVGTSSTPVGQLNLDCFTLVCSLRLESANSRTKRFPRTSDPGGLAAHGVVVRVTTSITTVGGKVLL